MGIQKLQKPDHKRHRMRMETTKKMAAQKERTEKNKTHQTTHRTIPNTLQQNLQKRPQTNDKNAPNHQNNLK